MLSAAILAVFTLTHEVCVWHVFVIALSVGFINAFDVPTRQAFTMEMVWRADLRIAIALNSILFKLAREAPPGG